MTQRTYRFQLSATLWEWVDWWAHTEVGCAGDAHDNPEANTVLDKLRALEPAVLRADENRQGGWRWERTFALDLTPAEAGELSYILPPSAYSAPRGLDPLRDRLADASCKGEAR